MGRYVSTGKILGGRAYATATPGLAIWEAVTGGALEFDTHVLREGERLDHLAGQYYGDGKLWWIIAAASGIGWGLQVPPGTFIRIPTALDEVMARV